MTITTAVKPSVRKGKSPTRFGAANREQFEKTIAAGFTPVPLHSPFSKRNDSRTGKARQMGKAPRHNNWPVMHYDAAAVQSECMSRFWNMGYRIEDGVGALDIDERNGGIASLAKLQKKFISFKPELYPRAISGGGTGAGGHLLFKLPRGVKLKKSLADDGFPGLEPVCAGRQLVSPGSIHPETGRMYEWDWLHPDIEDGLPELPADVLAFFTRPKRDRTTYPDAGRYTCEQVARMMRGLDPNDFRDYNKWLSIGMAIHYMTDGAGDTVWREWSAQDLEYFNEEEIDRKWDSFGTDKADPITHLFLLKLLHKAGKGNLIPILEGEQVSAQDDFDDLPDDIAEEREDDWLNAGLGPLDDLSERAATDTAAPFETETLAALAKLSPHDLQKTLGSLKAAGFKQITALTQAIKKITPKQPGNKRSATQSSVLQRIVGSECDISLQSDGTVFASYVRDDVTRCVNVRSKEFDEWLAYRLFKVMGSAPSQQTLDELRRVVVATAKHEHAPIRPSFRRIARLDDAIYLDLCNDKREAVKITANGWKVIASQELPESFRFVRSAGMQALPAPATPEEGDIKSLRNLFTLKPDREDAPSITDSGFVLLVSFLLSCFTRGPYPILVMDGGAGTAKSTTTDLARSVIDPSFVPGRSMPASELDLFVAAQNSHIQLFDNLSHIPPWFSDALCRLSTGGGLSKRELFTDAEEVLMRSRNPVLLNGLHSDMLNRNDLLDRSLIVTLAKVAKNKTEERVRTDFAAGHPVALAGLLSMVVHGLRNLASVPEEGAKTRLADFERWLNACESYLWPRGTFQRVFMGMRATAKAKLLRHAPVSRALLSFMQDRESWSGTASELNQALYAIHDSANMFEGSPLAPEQRWPGAVHIFSRRLRDAQGMLLEAFKITIEFKESDDRTITIARELDFG